MTRVAALLLNILCGILHIFSVLEERGTLSINVCEKTEQGLLGSKCSVARGFAFMRSLLNLQ